MTAPVRLEGCATTPLGSYLKGLGVLRLVGEQCDPDATGRWHGDRFELSTRLERDQIVRFFLEDYGPTPVVTPWNNGSGFKPGSSDTAAKRLEAVEAGDEPRLAELRDTISTAREAVNVGSSRGLDFYSEPKDRKKGQAPRDKDRQWLITELRSRLSDRAVGWLDASVALSRDGVEFPPLLGTGGNVGRLDLSSNLNDRLLKTVTSAERDPDKSRRKRRDPRAWLLSSLFDEGTPHLIEASNGQFDPGATGGVNASRRGEGNELDNPWDFLLALEGALLFASAASRRIGASQGRTAVAPFTVGATAAGYGTDSQETSAGEFWAPVWSAQVTVGELHRFLGEGRATWRRRQARTGLDMARAVMTLGTDRGIQQFVRWGLPNRNGTNAMAVRLGSLRPKDDPYARILGDFDDWSAKVRRLKDRPAALETAMHRLDRAVYAAAVRPSARALQGCLIPASQAELSLSLSSSLRDRTSPFPRLNPDRWVPALEDGSPELLLATSLARSFDVDGSCLLRLTRPIELPGRFANGRKADHPATDRPPTFDLEARLKWDKTNPPIAGLGRSPILGVLVDVMSRRSLNPPVVREGGETADLDRRPPPGFHWSPEVNTSAISALLFDDLDWQRFDDLVLASLLLAPTKSKKPTSEVAVSSKTVIPAWDLLCPFFSRVTLRVNGQRVALGPRLNWVPMLAAGHVEEVVREAIRDLRIARLVPAVRSPAEIARTAPAGPLLVAALLFQLSPTEVGQSLSRVLDVDQGDKQ